MKSGAGDPFADDGDFDDQDDEQTDDHTESTESETMETETLPYKFRRDGVQDDRNHANLFLRDKAQDHVDDVVDAMEDTFDSESVYKIDVLEAMILAANDPERTVEDELREMGYGMK